MRALKAEDRREEAAQVAKLRRPAVAAWAVNQAVRRHRDRFDALLEAGTEVRRTQRRALSGVRQSGMREAARARRELIDELTGLALQALAERGANAETHRGDIAATFDSASADDDAAVTVTNARLTAPVPITSGFGSLDGLAVLPEEPEDEPDPVPASEDPDAAERERAAERRRRAMRALEEARRLVADAENAAKGAADAVVTRSAAADQAERAAQDAERTLRRRRQEAADLRERVATEQRRAEQARDAVEEHTALLRQREQELHDLDG